MLQIRGGDALAAVLQPKSRCVVLRLSAQLDLAAGEICGTSTKLEEMELMERSVPI